MIEFFNTILVHPLLNLLVYFYNYIPDIGVVIIIITIIVRLILLPSFHKSLKHQRAMTALQPKMNEIREKYKDDKERQAKALMELYKVHKVNPLSSCLPLLLQLPIFIALYQVFIQSLGGESLQGIYEFVNVPEHINTMFLGFVELSEKNVIMAVIAGLLQYFQGRLQMPKVQSTDQASKIMSTQMLYLFPLMTIILGATVLPAGLTLYWMVTTLFGIAQQYYILRKEANEALYGKQ